MDFLQNLQSLLGGGQTGGAGARASAGGGMGGLSGLLNPQMLGGLASALFGGKGGLGGASGIASGGAGGAIGSLLGALVSGGAGSLFGGGQEEPDAAMGGGGFAPSTASAEDRAERMLRALVYAAKADGHIDANEQEMINSQLNQLNIGPEGQRFVRRVMDEQLDPNAVASGVTDMNEAVQIYALSSALTNTDNFMEKSYLDGLASALRIPPNMREQVAARLRGGR